MVEVDTYRYLAAELHRAIDGDAPREWRSPEWRETATALNVLFSDAVTDSERNRVLRRLGLECTQILLQRQRAALVTDRLLAQARDAGTGKHTEQ